MILRLFRDLRFPRIVLAFIMLFLLGWGSMHPAYADATFISAPNRADMVHDPMRNILYITSGSEVLRYNLTTQSFLPSFNLGGRLMGIDLSPDGNTLAVADATYSTVQSWIYLVNVQTGASQKVVFPLLLPETEVWGTYSVAFGSDGNLLITEAAQWSPLRKYNLSTGTATVLLPLISGATILSSSADGSVIGFAEGSNTSGPWGRYRVSDSNTAVSPNGTFNFNYEISTSRKGTQFAIPTFIGTFVYDSNLAQIAFVWQQPAGALQPFGGVYDPTKDILYLSWGGTQEVRAFETTNFTQVATFNIGSMFNIFGMRQTYETGRLKISRDGSLLFAVVDGGIRYVQLVDEIPPVISITSPLAKDYLHTATFNITWSASDSGSGVASQSGTLDNAPVTNGQTIDLFFLSLGPHTVTVRATDVAGNSATASVTFNVVTNIDSLIAEKERVCLLGWINDPNVCKSLDAKLTEAKNAILRGQTNTAKSKLNDFISELNAQLGKAVNQQAYDLLKADALYVINHLP